MVSLRKVIQCAAIGGCLVIASESAHAGSISFQATDLTDVVAGEDLWKYDYALSGFSFAVDQGFSIYFDPASYSSLDDPPPAVGADWDIISFQPDPGLPADGIYDALALVADPSLSTPFSVSFVWLGGVGTSPGVQPFTINQFDQFGAISFLDSGVTVAADTPAPVPEPATLWLLGSGLAGCLYRRFRASR